MVLNEYTETRYGKIYVRVPESLAKLIRIAREKVRGRAEEIYTGEAIWNIGSQPDAIRSSTDFPEVFAVRAGVGVAALIVIFAAFAVPSVRTPERNQSSDVNSRAEGLIWTKNRVTCGGLEAYVAYRR